MENRVLNQVAEPVANPSFQAPVSDHRLVGRAVDAGCAVDIMAGGTSKHGIATEQ